MNAWHAIRTIAKRELASYFTSPVAYVFLVIFLLLTGFLTFTAGAFFATAALFGMFVLGSGFGAVINEALDTRWGRLTMFGELEQAVWSQLFGGVEFFGREWPEDPLPAPVNWLVLAFLCAVALAALHRKIRAHEVVR